MIVPETPSSELLYNTARIVGTDADGNRSIGTAFFFQFQIDEKKGVLVLVTNKHVIAGCRVGEFRLRQACQSEQGKRTPRPAFVNVSLSDFERVWTGHPNDDVDLCAMPVEPLRRLAQAKGSDIYYASFGEGTIPSDDILQKMGAIEEVIMVGYPIGLWDEVNNYPILRRGMSASRPAADFCGRAEALADVACFPGSSGSPVMIFNEGTYSDDTGLHVGGIRTMLLGVLYGRPELSPKGQVRVVHIPTVAQPIRDADTYHIGVYIKSKELIALKRHMFSVLKIA